MHVFRLPYPSETEARRDLLARLRRHSATFGEIEGDAEEGAFRFSTPLGPFVGSYVSLEGSEEVVVELASKPWMISRRLIEAEARKFLGAT